jgi:hypothetical protein
MLAVAGCSQTPPQPKSSSAQANSSEGARPSAIAGYVGTPVALPDGLDRLAWSTAQIDVDG